MKENSEDLGINELAGEVLSYGNLQKLSESLGEPTCAFGPSGANCIAGYILGVLLILVAAAGILMTIVGAGDLLNGRAKILGFNRSFDFCLLLVLTIPIYALLAFLAGPNLIRWAKSSSSFKLLICAEGFLYIRDEKIQICRWQQISAIEETITQRHLPGDFGLLYIFNLLPLGEIRSYKVYRLDGKEFAFTRDTVARLSRLAQIIRSESKARNIPWTIKRETWSEPTLPP